MKRTTYKEISRAWQKIFANRRKLFNPEKKADLNEVGATIYRYTDYKDFEAKGATLDIWGDFVVPGSDTLKVRIYEHFIDEKVYIVTSITEYFFWFIPFTYAEYIIKLPEDKIPNTHAYYNNFKVQDAVAFIATADKWNINKKMSPISTDKVSFIQNDSSGCVSYECGNNDYMLLDCTELP